MRLGIPRHLQLCRQHKTAKANRLGAGQFLILRRSVFGTNGLSFLRLPAPRAIKVLNDTAELASFIPGGALGSPAGLEGTS